MKLNCPNHDDQNASLHVYADGCFCFVCRYSCSHEELGLNGDEIQRVKKEPEDVSAMCRYVETLPTKTIRGLSLPEGPEGYYILWPGRDFYKLRAYRGSLRYKGPTGHRPPLFNLGPVSSTLVLVEGELNALSLATAVEERTWTIASPGSCNELERHIPIYLEYTDIHIIVDKDIPGVVSGLKLKEELLRRNKRVELYAVEMDFNDLLQKEGKAALQAWAETNLGLPRRV